MSNQQTIGSISGASNGTNSSSTNSRIVMPGVIPSSSGPNLSNDSRDDLLCDVICAIADFTVELALKISQKTGRSWAPKILQEQQRKRIKRRPSIDDPSKPRKPQTAYTSWCEHIRQKVREKDPSRALQIKDLAEMWKQLPENERAPWERKANEMKEKYHSDMCAWRCQGMQKNEIQNNTNIHKSMPGNTTAQNVPIGGGFPQHYGQYIDPNK